jgi:hypothetical protein
MSVGGQQLMRPHHGFLTSTRVNIVIRPRRNGISERLQTRQIVFFNAKIQAFA